jgi:hypothetical protein
MPSRWDQRKAEGTAFARGRVCPIVPTAPPASQLDARIVASTIGPERTSRSLAVDDEGQCVEQRGPRDRRRKGTITAGRDFGANIAGLREQLPT